jgi:hypothetical protein
LQVHIVLENYLKASKFLQSFADYAKFNWRGFEIEYNFCGAYQLFNTYRISPRIPSNLYLPPIKDSTNISLLPQAGFIPQQNKAIPKISKSKPSWQNRN